MQRVKNARKNSKSCTFSNQIEIRGAEYPLCLPKYLCKYLEHLDFNCGLSKNTIRAYSTDVLQVFQLQNEVKLFGPKIDGSAEYISKNEKSLITTDTCERWTDIAINKLRTWEDLGPKSRKRKISSLNGFVNWLRTHQKIALEIHIDSPSGPQRKLPHFISIDECMSLVNHLNSDPVGEIKEQQKTLFFLLYGCGLRISEACELKWEQISLTKKNLEDYGKRFARAYCHPSKGHS